MRYQEVQALVTVHENGIDAGHLMHGQKNTCWTEERMERVRGKGKQSAGAGVLLREELEMGHEHCNSAHCNSAHMERQF